MTQIQPDFAAIASFTSENCPKPKLGNVLGTHHPPARKESKLVKISDLNASHMPAGVSKLFLKSNPIYVPFFFHSAYAPPMRPLRGPHESSTQSEVGRKSLEPGEHQHMSFFLCQNSSVAILQFQRQGV